MTADGLHANTVMLTGPVTLYQSSGVRETLLSALGEGKDLRIDLADSGPWDLAGLQLLIAAVAAGREAGHAVTLAHVPGVCREVADRSGLAAWLTGSAESFQ